MNPSRSIVFLGGPDAGKSNYLFRTWLAIEAGNLPLVKDGLPSDLKYLNTGASALLSGAFAPHTSRDYNTACTIPVLIRSPRQLRATIVVPDASGERWLDLYRKREWYSFWDQYVAQDTGYILFVRAASGQVVPAMDWVTCERLYGRQLLADEASKLKDRTPTQVLLVDWLQIIRSQLNKGGRGPLSPRLSVIVSAWDAVPTDQQTLSPHSYLERNFPLFAQFLASNLHGFDARVFGVSIVAGDLKNDPAFRRQYLDGNPIDFGYVVCEQETTPPAKSPDIALPILWAMGT